MSKPSNPPYLHVLDGRLRVRVPEIKRVHASAAKVEQVLGRIDGITLVNANPTTGSVLVLFDSQVIGYKRILEEIRKLGFLRSSLSPARRNPTVTSRTVNAFASQVAGNIAKQFVQSATQMAVERLILALI